MEDKMGSKNVNISKCEAFQYGNHERKPKYGTSKSKNKWVECCLKRNQL